MRRADDVSTLTVAICQLERDFCDVMKAKAGFVSDADLVRTALWRFAQHLDVPVDVSTFAVRGGTNSVGRRDRRHRLPSTHRKNRTDAA